MTTLTEPTSTEPERLGKYTIQSILGEGGMGVVYQGFDPNLARTVAIKTIRRSLLEGKTEAELRQRFSSEARAAGRLIHSNIVTIHEYVEDDSGTPFFVMEYVEGKTLKDCIVGGRQFSVQEAAHIIQQVLSALAYSHKNGVVHRDIKPANIILLADDSVKIADFGIAKVEESGATKTGVILGTPQYLSPEQCLGESTDARTDLYSTGAVLYETLTGEKAFPGTSVTSVFSRLQVDYVANLSSTDPAIQRVIKEVVIKALQRQPADRFSSAAEFSEALRAAAMPPSAAKTGARESSKWLWLGGALGIALLAVVFYIVEPPSAPLSEAEQQQLDKSLKVANIHFAINRLILPEGSSAYDSYKRALEIDPRNRDAHAGIEAIQEKIAAQVQHAWQDGDTEAAKSRLAVALRIFPRSQSLRALQEEIDKEP